MEVGRYIACIEYPTSTSLGILGTILVRDHHVRRSCPWNSGFFNMNKYRPRPSILASKIYFMNLFAGATSRIRNTKFLPPIPNPPQLISTSLSDRFSTLRRITSVHQQRSAIPGHDTSRLGNLALSQQRKLSLYQQLRHTSTAMSSKLVPPNPAEVMVIRDVTPNIATLSVPFARFGIFKVGGRATISKPPAPSLHLFTLS